MPRFRRKHKVISDKLAQATIESLTQDARGVAHLDGKVVFIEGGLPGEEVMFRYLTQRTSFDEGVATEVLAASPTRAMPRCTHFGLCGGCSLQHMAPEAQIQAKQQVVLDTLKHIGKVEPETKLPPLSGPAWGYRRRARLGAKYVVKKDKLLVGFREKRSALLADLTHCDVLHPVVGALLPELRTLLAGLASYNQIPQIEVAVGDGASALVFRHLVELSPADLNALRAFGQAHTMQIYLQAAGPHDLRLLWPEVGVELSYKLPNYNVELFFSPTDFIQVNADVNRQTVDRVVELLDLQPDDRVLDLFCGLGNFTLPLARRAAYVIGVEGDERLVRRAQDNATRNAISNIEFYVADLDKDITGPAWVNKGFDKILLDPPRTGALEVVKQLATLRAASVVYVSCNPATLARDAHEIVHNQGYQLVSAGVMDMFPHTTHIESIALFERPGFR